jgi:hypothetical protein
MDRPLEWLLGSGAMHVYVDGQLVTKVSQKYPEFSSWPLEKCYLGMAFQGSQIPERTTFYGGIGTMIILSEFSNPAAVQDLMEITADYAPDFQEKEYVLCNYISFSSAFAKFQNKIACAVSPKVRPSMSSQLTSDICSRVLFECR